MAKNRRSNSRKCPNRIKAATNAARKTNRLPNAKPLSVVKAVARKLLAVK